MKRKQFEAALKHGYRSGLEIKIKDLLVELNIPGEALIVPYRGIKFGLDGQNEAVRGVLMQVQNGKYCTVYPYELAACDLVYPMPTWDKK